MFLIKQVSSDLGITPQAIYKQKEELQSKGYMIKNSSNDWEITSDGYNYLKEKQINRFKRNNVSLKENDMKSADSQGKEAKNSLNETLINFYETRLEEIKQSYENQLDEQKKQVEYFKNLYEEEKSKCFFLENVDLQEVNSNGKQFKQKISSRSYDSFR